MRLAERQVWCLVADRAHRAGQAVGRQGSQEGKPGHAGDDANEEARHQGPAASSRDRKSTRLNSSHSSSSYAVSCLKKKRFKIVVIDIQITLKQMLRDFIGIR